MQLLKPPWVNHDDGQAMFSVDIHPDGSRFATGGQGQGQDASGRVVIWSMKPVLSEKHEDDAKFPKLLCQLDQHLGCVNCVRWSKAGQFLASAGDDKVVIIWQLSSYGGGSVFGSNVVNVEWWRCVSTLRGHDGDILDVAWAPHDAYLASVSVDNTVIVWNTTKWDRVKVLRGHRGLVKGVTWDPVGRYVATQADDRTLVVWRTADWQQETVVSKPFQECGGTTSVLRPGWSPDGQYLVSAHAMNNGGPTAQIIDRDHWTTDTDFVGHRKPITCVRFNPNILTKVDAKSGRNVHYCCLAIGSRDRSVSIWFTSLKRPMVVIHDLFEDSVLDLAFSSCGRHLLAVSKDGSLTAITFTAKEMGRALTSEETDNVYLKLYGKCSSNNSSTTAAIIDNPELLKARELAKQQQLIQQQQQQHQLNLSTASNNSSRSLNNSSMQQQQRGPDKQIERRTADGRRRITPVFIPPSADGVSMQSFETFSTSRQEKSRIVIEKLDGIVEPNVTTPSKNLSSSNSNTAVKPAMAASEASTATSSPTRGQTGTDTDPASIPLLPPPELDGVNPGLTARLERVGKNQEKSSELVTSTPVNSATANTTTMKRRLDEPQPIAVKRKRGRPPLDRSTTYQQAGNTSIITPSSPPHVQPTNQMVPSATTVIATKTNQPTSAMATVAMIPASQLPPAAITATHRVQAGDLTVLVEANWREVSGSASCGASVGRCLHRITAQCNGALKWVYYATARVTAVAAGDTFVAVTCSDGSLVLLARDTGCQLWPSIQLAGACARLCAQDGCLLIVTTTAHCALYDVRHRRRLMAECVMHLVEGRMGKEGIKNIHLIKSQDCDNNEELSTAIKSSNDKVINGGQQTENTEKTPVNGTVRLTGDNIQQNGVCEDMDTDGEHQPVKQVKVRLCPAQLPRAASKVVTKDQMLRRFTPVIVLGTGEVFARCRELESWLQLGECSAVRRAVSAQYTSLPPVKNGSTGPLAGLLRHTTAYLGSSRDVPGECGSELKSALTETFLKKMITSAAYLSSKKDYSFWYTRLVHLYSREGDERKLRAVFDELLSSDASASGETEQMVSTVLPQHQRLLDGDRSALLRGYLADLLLGDTTGRLQRLYTEYTELLDARVGQDIMI